MSLKLGPTGKLLIVNGKLTDDTDCCCTSVPDCVVSRAHTLTWTFGGWNDPPDCTISISPGAGGGTTHTHWLLGALNTSFSTSAPTIVGNRVVGTVQLANLPATKGVLVYQRETLGNSRSPDQKAETYCTDVGSAIQCSEGNDGKLYACAGGFSAGFKTYYANPPYTTWSAGALEGPGIISFGSFSNPNIGECSLLTGPFVPSDNTWQIIANVTSIFCPTTGITSYELINPSTFVRVS